MPVTVVLGLVFTTGVLQIGRNVLLLTHTDLSQRIEDPCRESKAITPYGAPCGLNRSVLEQVPQLPLPAWPQT